MRELGLFRAFELGDDALRENFAEFDAPLVERIDLPDGALGEDAVLVERDEFAERFGSELVEEDSVRRAVAFEDAMRNEPRGSAFSLDLLGGLAESESFGLGENVGQKHVVMMAERIQRFVEGDKIAGDVLRSLMDQLVEGMLAVGAGLAP